MLLAAAALLLALSLWLPLWSTRLESPQYHGDEALKVAVFAGHVSGDVREVETLNQYVGVRLPLDAPELRAASWVIGMLLILAVSVLLVPARRRRAAGAMLFGLMLAVAISATALAQYRLYQLGHHRAHGPLARVADFTPPVLGSLKVYNFEVHTGIEPGGWAFLGAIALAAWVAFVPRRRPTVVPARRREGGSDPPHTEATPPGRLQIHAGRH
jgi:uncharacterized membrane protein